MLEASRGEWAKRGYIAMVVAAYFIVSISMVFINKVLLYTTQFERPIPIFIMWFQSILSVVICWALGELSHAGVLSGHSRQTFNVVPAVKVMSLSVIFVGMILFNQLCLQYVEVSFYNVARSLTIVFNVILSYIFLGQTTSGRALLTIVVVIYGFYLGAEGEVNFSLVGTLFGVCSSLFVALYSVYTSSALTHLNNDKSKLIFYNNINSCILMVPIMLYFEGDVLFRSMATTTLAFWAMMMVAGVLGFLIGVVTMWQIQVTSPLTHNISGTAKASVQTVLALMIWGNPVTAGGIVGIALILGGSLAYSIVKMQESAAKNASASHVPVQKKMDTYTKVGNDESDFGDDLFDDVDVGELTEGDTENPIKRV